MALFISFLMNNFVSLPTFFLGHSLIFRMKLNPTTAFISSEIDDIMVKFEIIQIFRIQINCHRL